jgi:hypothetical protein
MSKSSRRALHARLSPFVSAELDLARKAVTNEAWARLERAHILSQPFAGLHVKVHVHMIGRAFRDRRWGELLGQLPRIVLAGPSSLFERYPRGNRGTTASSMFAPEPVPPDLDDLLNPPQRPPYVP